MATDKVHFRHVLFLPAARPREGGLAAEGRRLSDGRAAGWSSSSWPECVPMMSALAVRGGRLRVQGTRRDGRHEGLDCHRLEIDYSRFERLLELPGHLGIGRDRGVVPRRDAVDTDHDGGTAVTSETR